MSKSRKTNQILPQSLNFVEIDAIDLTNGMLGVLERLFPGENSLGRLSIVNPVERQSNVSDSGAKGQNAT